MSTSRDARATAEFVVQNILMKNMIRHEMVAQLGASIVEELLRSDVKWAMAALSSESNSTNETNGETVSRTVPEMVAIIDKNLGEIADESSGATEAKLREEIGPWMAGFRTAPLHRELVTQVHELLEGMIRTGASQKYRGRAVTSLALQYFLLGRRVARIEFPEDVWAAFHKVWTFTVGKPGYDKKQFMALEAELLRMHRETK